MERVGGKYSFGVAFFPAILVFQSWGQEALQRQRCSCCLGGTDQCQICFARTSEARLDGVAESVALQGVVRVHTFGEVHAEYASSDMGMSAAGTHPFTRDLRSIRANMSWQAPLAFVMLPRSANACLASILTYSTSNVMKTSVACVPTMKP